MDNVTPLYYQVYYMNNDRQKVVVARNLMYHQAVRFCQRHYREYNAELHYEEQK